jgi:hypothetical protein
MQYRALYYKTFYGRNLQIFIIRRRTDINIQADGQTDKQTDI